MTATSDAAAAEHLRVRGRLRRSRKIVPAERAGSAKGLRFLIVLQVPGACLGLVVGVVDLVSAPWLQARGLGLVLFLLGALTLAGTFPVGIYGRLSGRVEVGRLVPAAGDAEDKHARAQRRAEKRRRDATDRLTFAGAVAGTVIAVIFALSALHYNEVRLSLFVLCGMPSVLTATLFYRWSLLKRYPRLAVSAGVVGGLLSVVPFLYNTIYLPSTADVAIEATLQPASPASIGSGLQLVDLQISLEDKSSIPATVLTSMVTVTGYTYTGGSGDFASPQSQSAQSSAAQIGLGKSLNPNLEFTGLRTPTLLTLRRAVNDGSTLFPQTPLDATIPVLIPAGHYQELDISYRLLYARSDRLTLTDEYSARHIYANRKCAADDVRAAWFIAQSEFDRITRGTETAVTDWCSAVDDPWIGTFIGGAPGTRTSASVVELEGQRYKVRSTSRYWILSLSAATTPEPHGN
jgi:hypothetical protein